MGELVPRIQVLLMVIVNTRVKVFNDILLRSRVINPQTLPPFLNTLPSFTKTGTLAMETLLSLTSKRAGEWFKEELRQLGGVDHLVRTVTTCVLALQAVSHHNTTALCYSPTTLDTFSKVERCLKVLENVSCVMPGRVVR